MAYYLNQRKCIISVPHGKPVSKYNPVVETIHLKPMKPELVADEVEADFLQNAQDFIDDGTIKRITDEEAKALLQKWEADKKRKNFIPMW